MKRINIKLEFKKLIVLSFFQGLRVNIPDAKDTDVGYIYHGIPVLDFYPVLNGLQCRKKHSFGLINQSIKRSSTYTLFFSLISFSSGWKYSGSLSQVKTKFSVNDAFPFGV